VEVGGGARLEQYDLRRRQRHHPDRPGTAIRGITHPHKGKGDNLSYFGRGAQCTTGEYKCTTNSIGESWTTIRSGHGLADLNIDGRVRKSDDDRAQNGFPLRHRPYQRKLISAIPSAKITWATGLI